MKVDDGQPHSLELVAGVDLGQFVTTEDILLGPGMTACVSASCSLSVPDGFALVAAPAACPPLRVAPSCIRGQRQGPFWLFNSGDSAVAVPAGSSVIQFSLHRDVPFSMNEVTL